MPTVMSIFDKVDSRDPHVFSGLFAHDATAVFGNAEPLLGREAIAVGAEAFLSSIAGLRHRLLNEWHVDGTTIAETEVTYTRLDGNEVTIPVVSIWQVRDDGLLVAYRVFFDLAPVYAT
jgi:hypothetical protein